VRQRDTSIRHHDHQVSQTQFETRVPASTQDDDLSVEMSSLKWARAVDEALGAERLMGSGANVARAPV
jgi:hypothetical protein